MLSSLGLSIYKFYKKLATLINYGITLVIK